MISIFSLLFHLHKSLDNIWNPKSPESTTISGCSQTAMSTRIKLQLAAFKAVDRPFPDVDIFGWWTSNVAQFPDLARLARILHSIPATSICSERLFSKAGLIYANTLRNRYDNFWVNYAYFKINLSLSADMVDKILVIKANLDAVHLAPSTEPDVDDLNEEIQLDE